MACGFCGFDGGDVQAQLEAGPAPRHPHHLLPENLAGQLLTVGGGGDRDPGIGMQMIHMRRIDQTMHRRVNARGGAALAVQAEIERRDHLILPLHPRIDLDQRPHPVQPQHRQTRSRSTCPDRRRSPSPTTTRPAPRSPDQPPTPSPTCSRPHSWCSSDPHPSRFYRPIKSATACWSSSGHDRLSRLLSLKSCRRIAALIRARNRRPGRQLARETRSSGQRSGAPAGLLAPDPLSH